MHGLPAPSVVELSVVENPASERHRAGHGIHPRMTTCKPPQTRRKTKRCGIPKERPVTVPVLSALQESLLQAGGLTNPGGERVPSSRQGHRTRRQRQQPDRDQRRDCHDAKAGCGNITPATDRLFDETCGSSSHAEFAASDGNDFVACAYQAGGGGNTLLLSGLMPTYQTCTTNFAKCWNNKVRKWAYKDPRGTPEGVGRATLKAGDGRAQIKVKALGESIGWQEEAPLPVTLPVRVQLQSEEGLCWESLFSSALKNQGGIFKAVADRN